MNTVDRADVAADDAARGAQGRPRPDGRAGGRGREGQGRGRRTASGRARQPRPQAGARARGSGGPGRGRHAGRPARAAEAAAARARRADQRQLRAAEEAGGGIRRADPRARAAAARRLPGNTGGFLFRPVPGPVTSPFGWRRHPIYGYWGLHDGTDFSAPCGTPNHAAGSGTVISKVLVERLRQPPVPRPRPGQRQEHDGRLQPPQRLPRRTRASTSGAARHRVRRQHGLVHRLPPALHRAAQRQPGEPDELHVERRRFPRPPGETSSPGRQCFARQPTDLPASPTRFVRTPPAQLGCRP